MNRYYLGIIFILISALGYGLLPILALLTYKTGNIAVTTLLFWRFFLAAICLLVYTSLRVKEWYRVSRRQLCIFFVLGSILYTLQTIFYMSAIKYIPPGLAIAIVYIYPLLVALLSVILKEEQLTRTTVISMALSLVGVSTVLKATFSDFNYYGAALALGTAVACSFYMVVGKKYTTGIPPLITTTFVVSFAAGAFFVLGVANHSLQFDLSPSTWLYMLAIALISTVVAILAFFAGLKIIGVTRSAILSTVEPLITMGSATLFLGNAVTLWQLLGTLLIIASACILTLKEDQPTDTAVQ
jgi:drug/metabolite transporter (DMT)-like permease